MGREVEYPLNSELKENLDKLLAAINKLRWAYGKPMKVSSGYRPGKYNEAAGGAKNSSHLTCQAVDFQDTDRAITQWVLSKPQILEDCGLYMEHYEQTPTWIHLQIRLVASGSRIFRK